MRFEFDEEARALYVYLSHPDANRDGSVKKTLVDYWPNVNVDIGWDDNPIGLEFLEVSERRLEDGSQG